MDVRVLGDADNGEGTPPVRAGERTAYVLVAVRFEERDPIAEPTPMLDPGTAIPVVGETFVREP